MGDPSGEGDRGESAVGHVDARADEGGDRRLLRQVGTFGVLLCKDFSSVLAQNKDARAEAMAALREVYDGDWHRPVGTDGGKVKRVQGAERLLKIDIDSAAQKGLRFQVRVEAQ